ncbi:MAG: poly-beta-hydroxybutyrate polymerase [Micavibrio aeruginosavorus]|uniref:Poly-beta-hydroxybutyrate polymerase n=1 Tax=Micavibrio aeruginosavorus TaxID=349221 RepID=A0A2W5A1K9_9BACT|nr:MAG: poly-beta-hydroxybutyrate polymerase [Micavibrio aeruginosavorus]
MSAQIMMRQGPKPLPFQLGMASLASTGIAGGTQFDAETLQRFFQGIQKYQKHPFKRDMPELDIVWSDGEARLFHAAPEKKKFANPVFLIPSMVNGSEILDLLPGRSLLRFLADEGYDAYLLDWGQAAQDQGQATFDAAVVQRLIPAIEAAGSPVLLLGYCMGGLFAAAVASLRPDLVRGCVMLATPWNFHDTAGALKARLSIMKPMAIPYMTQYARLPESWMQAVFATLDPESSIKKFASFAAMTDEGEAAEMFVAVEDWLNEGVDLPAGIARTCMDEWYERNEPFDGTWTVCGSVIRAQDIKAPTFVIAAKGDKIVPPDSAMAFAQQRAKCDTLLYNGGHISLIAGARAKDEVWRRLSEWFAMQQKP